MRMVHGRLFALLVFLIAVASIHFLIEDAEATKGLGVKNPQTNSDKVCGDKLCSQLLTKNVKPFQQRSSEGVFQQGREPTFSPEENFNHVVIKAQIPKSVKIPPDVFEKNLSQNDLFSILQYLAENKVGVIIETYVIPSSKISDRVFQQNLGLGDETPYGSIFDFFKKLVGDKKPVKNGLGQDVYDMDGDGADGDGKDVTVNENNDRKVASNDEVIITQVKDQNGNIVSETREKKDTDGKGVERETYWYTLHNTCYGMTNWSYEKIDPVGNVTTDQGDYKKPFPTISSSMLEMGGLTVTSQIQISSEGGLNTMVRDISGPLQVTSSIDGIVLSNEESTAVFEPIIDLVGVTHPDSGELIKFMPGIPEDFSLFKKIEESTPGGTTGTAPMELPKVGKVQINNIFLVNAGGSVVIEGSPGSRVSIVADVSYDGDKIRMFPFEPIFRHQDGTVYPTLVDHSIGLEPGLNKYLIMGGTELTKVGTYEAILTFYDPDTKQVLDSALTQYTVLGQITSSTSGEMQVRGTNFSFGYTTSEYAPLLDARADGDSVIISVLAKRDSNLTIKLPSWSMRGSVLILTDGEETHFEMKEVANGTILSFSVRQGAERIEIIGLNLTGGNIPPVIEPPETKSEFTLSCDPASPQVLNGVATSTCILTSSESATVTLSCDNLPLNSNCTFVPNPVQIPAGGRAKSQLTVKFEDTVPSSFSIISDGPCIGVCPTKAIFWMRPLDYKSQVFEQPKHQITIEHIQPSDMSGNPVLSFSSGMMSSIVFLNAASDVTGLVSVTLVGPNHEPISSSYFKGKLSQGPSEVQLPLIIPENAAVDVYSIHGSVLTDLPQYGGFPLSSPGVEDIGITYQYTSFLSLFQGANDAKTDFKTSPTTSTVSVWDWFELPNGGPTGKYSSNPQNPDGKLSQKALGPPVAPDAAETKDSSGKAPGGIDVLDREVKGKDAKGNPWTKYGISFHCKVKGIQSFTYSYFAPNSFGTPRTSTVTVNCK